MIKQKTFSFFGETWDFIRDPKLKDWGESDRATKLIRIKASLRGRNELDTTIHEFLHACFDFLDETYVERAGTDIATALWVLGYRKTKNEKPKKVATRRNRKANGNAPGGQDESANRESAEPNENVGCEQSGAFGLAEPGRPTG